MTVVRSPNRPADAAGPANLPVMAAPLPASSVGSAGGVRLDVDAAEVAVRKLENVRREIEVARDEAVRVAQTPPTARDAVSLEAFALLAQKADGGPGSFTAAMDGARTHVDQLIVQLRADIAQQRALDEAAASELSGRA